jgi:hypothetical protein
MKKVTCALATVLLGIVMAGNIYGAPITTVTAGPGLIGGGSGDVVTLEVGQGAGISVGADTVSVNFAGTGSAATAARSDHNHNSADCVGNSAGDIMVRVGPLCVDKYEASVWSNSDGTGTEYGADSDNYPSHPSTGKFPDNGNWTKRVYAVSKAGVKPSRYITWFQAQQACALSGKRLLTNAEWQMAAAGTPDSNTSCNFGATGTNALANTGSFANCVSKWHVNDMVGNLFEWVADWIQGNTDPWVPATDLTSTSTGSSYGNDYIYGINPATRQGSNSSSFPAALIRGGYWGNGLSGVFSMVAGIAPSHSTDHIGFRCGR